MLLVFPVAALFTACGVAPNGATSRLASQGALATVHGSTLRTDPHLNGAGWTIKAPIPEPLGVAQGAVVASSDGSQIYHIGGLTGALVPTKKVRVYSTADDTWSDAADIPVTTGIRTFGAAIELNGLIYVLGGVDEIGVLDTTWIYDEVQDTWVQTRQCTKSAS